MLQSFFLGRISILCNTDFLQGLKVVQHTTLPKSKANKGHGWIMDAKWILYLLFPIMTNMEPSQTYMQAYNTIVLCHFNQSALKIF